MKREARKRRKKKYASSKKAGWIRTISEDTYLVASDVRSESVLRKCIFPF